MSRYAYYNFTDVNETYLSVHYRFQWEHTTIHTVDIHCFHYTESHNVQDR